MKNTCQSLHHRHTRQNICLELPAGGRPLAGLTKLSVSPKSHKRVEQQDSNAKQPHITFITNQDADAPRRTLKILVGGSQSHPQERAWTRKVVQPCGRKMRDAAGASLSFRTWEKEKQQRTVQVATGNMEGQCESSS